MILACALIEFWAGLYTPELQGQLAAGVKIILSWAHRVLARQVHTTLPLLHQAVMDTAAVAERNQEDDAVAQLGLYNRVPQLPSNLDDTSDQEEL